MITEECELLTLLQDAHEGSEKRQHIILHVMRNMLTLPQEPLKLTSKEKRALFILLPKCLEREKAILENDEFIPQDFLKDLDACLSNENYLDMCDTLEKCDPCFLNYRGGLQPARIARMIGTMPIKNALIFMSTDTRVTHSFVFV